jgi:hypothetical protein
MLENMKKTRRIVIKSIMIKCVNDEIDINEGIRMITAFDKEAKDAFEAIVHYQEVCLHYTEDSNVMKGEG